MSEQRDVVVVLVTVPDSDAGAKIARRLLEERWIACANVVPAIRSLYWWQGEIEDAGESLVIMKGRSADVQAIASRVRQLHPYEVPEVIAVPVTGGSSAYLDWVRGETSRDE